MMSFKQRITIQQDRAFLAAIAFSFFLFFYEEWFWKAHIFFFFLLGEHASLPIRLLGTFEILLSFFLVFLYMWVSLTARRRWRPVYFLLFAAALIAQYGYGMTLDRFMTVRDLYTAFASPLRLWLDSASFVAPASFLPIGLYALLLWWLRHEQQTGWKGLTAVLSTLFLVGASFFYLDQQLIRPDLNLRFFTTSPALSLPAMFKTMAGTFIAEAQVARLDREKLTYQASEPPQNNIVFVVDESLRGDHLSVNDYHRPTTPHLEGLAAEGFLTTWGIGAAAVTDSRQANSVLISGISQLPDPDFKHEQNPTLFQYAKAMGYTTYYFDAQTSYLWNSMSTSDLEFVDHWINADQLIEGMDVDLQVAEQVHAITKQSVGNFILVNKNGVHFHYPDRYPPEQAVWVPVAPAGFYDDQPAVVNAYDNAILYNVNGFWERLIPTTEAMQSTSYLYTSDHGETLLENGETWMHGGDSQQEARIPILLIGQHTFNVDASYKASHYNLFPTLLDLMDVPEEARSQEYPLSLLTATAADSAPRIFFSGDGTPVAFEEP